MKNIAMLVILVLTTFAPAVGATSWEVANITPVDVDKNGSVMTHKLAVKKPALKEGNAETFIVISNTELKDFLNFFGHYTTIMEVVRGKYHVIRQKGQPKVFDRIFAELN